MEFKEYDVKVIHKCTSARHALKAQSVGVSAITIDGFGEVSGEDDIPSCSATSSCRVFGCPRRWVWRFSDAKSLVAALALEEAIVMELDLWQQKKLVYIRM